ncbi:MAG TPA: GNAT family N-acetyltransferase, partial [Terriglobales bacterium]|nr:GNAT family N-acetyltransferase [Terriglobales bacterium]
RRYAMTELNNVMARRLTPADRFAGEVEGVEFRSCPPDDAMLWTRTMLAGFFAESQVPAGWEDLIFPMALLPHSLAMIAWAGGEPVGAFAGMICPQWRLLMLAGTSTLPAWRGRGIQTAAIARRLQQGIDAGCDLAVVVTRAGTTSQRNAERMGFTLAYTKATLVGPDPPSS